MKRRLLSKIGYSEDVCLLCTFRSRASSPFHYPPGRQQARHLMSSAAQFQEPATKQKDDGEDGFSMLKRNSGLAFPTRAKPKVPEPLRQESAPQRQQGSFGSRDNRSTSGRAGPSTKYGNTQRQSRPDSKPLVRFFDARGRGDVRDPDQSRKPPRERYGNKDTPFGGRQDTYGLPPRNSTGNQESRNPGSRRQDMSNIRDRYRYKPDSVEDAPVQFSPRGRGFDRPGSARETPVGQSDFKPFGVQTSGTSRATTPIDRRVQSRTRKSDDAPSEVSFEDNTAQAVPDRVAAPAGSSFDSSYDEHSDRRKTAKRAKFSDRFEVEEDEEAPVPQQTTRRTPRYAQPDFDYEMAEAEELLYGGRGRNKKTKKQKKAEMSGPVRSVIQIPEFISVERLARLLKVDVAKFIQHLEDEGYEGAQYDHTLDYSTSAMFADVYGFEASPPGTDSVRDLVARPAAEDVSVLPPRPPIVTIMGHVDHGKTTILDYLRKSSVVASEHGGITQHIGAFSVRMPGTNRLITFLDTPGHAAFLEMRKRGANVTDIVVLVVAADDSVKPQTIEAIKHAREANVQIIIAINKVDKPDADVERVKQDLTRHDIVVEDYGGEYQAISLSGKTGQGMDQLEEAIVTLADVYDFRAEETGAAEGWIIESKVTIAGRVATVLVRRGTLRPGDFIVAGTTWARVRTLRNDAGQPVTEALPGTPVQVDGWRGEDPTAGLEVLQADDEEHAKDVIHYRLEQRESEKTAVDIAAINSARTEEAEDRAKVLAWESEQEWAKRRRGNRPKDNEGWVEGKESSGPKKVHFVIKADVAGSVEALVAAVSAIGNNEVVANVIHSGTGLVSESDIKMLAATGETGYAISFNQSVEPSTARLAYAAGLQIMDHNIIYKVTDTVKERLAEHLAPVVSQRVLGEAEIGQVFEISLKKRKAAKIAGCRVTNGTISRGNKVRLQRNGAIIYTGTLDSLKNVKKDVSEMRKGTECGMGFEEWQDFEVGDQVQCFEEIEEKRTFY